LSQDRKSRFMAGKQDSPERGKTETTTVFYLAGAYFPIHFFMDARKRMGDYGVSETLMAL
ncbi:hypothetical protein, partial [uncultured Akkermansia sp.]|uniref:hypothetical protein n=1 Tax=uncultured Akkermansia sp. TaxID=512294 RepID=UPI00265D3EF6